MNTQECIDLLAVVAAYDRRTVGESDVLAWSAALTDLPLDPCKRAVIEYYSRETTWLMPAHLRKLVTAERNDHAMRTLPSWDGDLKPKPAWFDAAAAAFKRRDKAEGERIVAAGRRGEQW